mmetsp:Transcript_123512/g.395062  ORF Transcript_123512/g.395062 Transcript_123512/m.395062 type:complete len:202 (-) Transcript_123512:219-824(-)
MWCLPACSTAFSGAMFFVVPYVIAEDFDWQLFRREPWQAAGYIAANLVLSLLSISFKYMGPKFCPAALSATVYTASSMLSGYTAQIVLFGVIPGAYTLGGAALMLLAVFAMALARHSQPKKEAMSPTASPTADGQQSPLDIDMSPAPTNDLDNGETESLATFIASEFSELSHHERTARRRVGAATAPDAQQIGATSVVAMA